MSLFCAISGQAPLQPVLSTTSGHVYEKDLVLKYLKDNDGRDPITGEALTEDQLVPIKTAPSTPSAAPRPPSFTSVPALLHVLQGEWDATMLECLELRKQGSELRQELSHALYKEDAAMRVLARLTRERDEAREALASVKATLGPAFSTGDAPSADVEMEVEAEDTPGGLPADAKKRVVELSATLEAARKKRKQDKPPASTATAAEVASFVQSEDQKSMHSTKPAGMSCLALAKDGSLTLTGGLDKSVILFDRATSKIITTLKAHTKKVTAVLATVAITSEGIPAFLVSASLDKTVRVWAPNGNKPVYGATALTHGGEVNALALHPTDTLVASAAADGTWSIIDLSTPKPSILLTVSLPADAPEGTANTAIAFHPDGKLLGVGSSDSVIRFFDIATGACLKTFPAHAAEGAITSLTFSENGYSLASGAVGSDQVKLWDLREGKPAESHSLPAGAVVNSVRFDTSAQFLAAGGSDLRVWAYKKTNKVVNWDQVVLNEDNQSELTGVEWGTDGKELVTAGLDRSIRVLAAPKAAAE
ncbi:hypothetical protein RQP46_006384 [Phenoliferia psychrophenolica]